MDQETEYGKKISQAQKELNANVSAKSPTLTEKEVENLVVNDKWLMTLRTEVESEVEKISQNLTRRIKDLAVRYTDPLPKLEEELRFLKTKVEEHIAKMGFK
jgi:type I restriction enzyme M protein